MIAGCIDRIRKDSCGPCERRNACSFQWTDLLRFDAPRRPPETDSRGGAGPKNAFRVVLGELAKALERSGKGRAPAGRGEAAPETPPQGSLRLAVERQIEPLLKSGDVRIEAVARALGVSRQTLYRRLKEEGATFEQVLDGLRRRLAWRYVRMEGMAVKEAAWRLGFSDPAAFSRAFKRWTGMSPANARASNGA